MDKLKLGKITSVGLTYQQYMDLIRKEVEVTASVNLNNEVNKTFENRKLNLHRMTRIEKHYVVSDELKNLILQNESQQTWMIISETWCGDSAQNIPFIAKIVESTPKIELKIILRDTNPDIMDMYLTIEQEASQS